jgi:hypothetical protein
VWPGSARAAECFFGTEHVRRERWTSIPRERRHVGERELRSWSTVTHPSGESHRTHEARGGRFQACFEPPSMVLFHLSSREWQPAISSFLNSESKPAGATTSTLCQIIISDGDRDATSPTHGISRDRRHVFRESASVIWDRLCRVQRDV